MFLRHWLSNEGVSHDNAEELASQLYLAAEGKGVDDGAFTKILTSIDHASYRQVTEAYSAKY